MSTPQATGCMATASRKANSRQLGPAQSVAAITLGRQRDQLSPSGIREVGEATSHPMTGLEITAADSHGAGAQRQSVSTDLYVVRRSPP
jgi:hypothetical protein